MYILYGEDDFSLKEWLSGLREGADIQVRAADKLGFDELIAICNTLPFLAPKRLIIVEGLLSRFEPREGRSVEASEWRDLAEQAAHFPPTTTLALSDGKLSPFNPLLRELAPKAEVREFTLLKGAELENWIHKRAAGLGSEISNRAVKLLAELIGGNLWILSREIEKLCLYAAGRHINEEDVRKLVSYAREASIFVLADAIVGRQLQKASHLLREFFDEGAAPPYLLYMITRQFRLVIQAKEMASRGLSAKEIGQSLGISSDYLLEKVLGQAGKYSAERLGKIYRRLLEADVSIKTGSLKGELALELLMAEICSSEDGDANSAL